MLTAKVVSEVLSNILTIKVWWQINIISPCWANVISSKYGFAVVFTNHDWPVIVWIELTAPVVGLIWNICICVLLNAIIYFSSSENIKGSNLTSCLNTEKSVTASRVVSDVTTSKLSLPPSSLLTVTTFAAGLATVNPSTAF